MGCGSLADGESANLRAGSSGMTLFVIIAIKLSVVAVPGEYAAGSPVAGGKLEFPLVVFTVSRIVQSPSFEVRLKFYPV